MEKSIHLCNATKELFKGPHATQLHLVGDSITMKLLDEGVDKNWHDFPEILDVMIINGEEMECFCGRLKQYIVKFK